VYIVEALVHKVGEESRRAAEGPGRDGVDPRAFEHTFTYKHVHIIHTITRPRLAYPLRCRGY
jgi:hypothetical protein